MSPHPGSPSRVAAVALVAAGLAGALLLSDPTTTDAAQQSNFVGGAPSVLESEEVNTLRLRFEAGSRSSWHGAAPDEAAVQLTIYSGEVDWMEAVPDETYEAPVD